MAKVKALTQVLRIDGKNCFCEVMCDALGIDKVLVNFVSYDTTNTKGSRETGHVCIYMNIFEARMLAGDILSGRIAKDGKLKAAKAAEKTATPENNGRKFYPEPSYTLLGGSSGANTADKKPISRQFMVTKGMTMPWVLEATSGPGKIIGKGLIAPDGNPTTRIRIGMKDESLKQFAYAIQTCCDLWVQAKFMPVVAPMLAEARAQTEAALKALSKNGEPNDVPEEIFDDVEDELPY